MRRHRGMGWLIATWASFLVAGFGALRAEQPPASEDLRSELKTYPHKVVYETNRDGNWELYIVNADGSGAKNLTNSADVDELYPKPSPDGTKIAFVADRGQGADRRRDVYVMNSDGSDRVEVADNAREPCWSPDGKSIGYLKGEFEKYNLQDFATKGIYMYDLATKETRQHPNKKIEHLYTLNWPLGGKWFVATVHGGMGLSHAIIAVQADGDRVVDLHLGGCRPNVRFDGKQIAWGHGDFCAGVADLDLAADTPKATNIHHAVESDEPVETYHVTWSPDGKYLTYTTGPKAKKKNLKGLLPEFPGVEAPGWNVCVADASKKNRWIALTTDGKSNKQPSFVFVKEKTAP